MAKKTYKETFGQIAIPKPKPPRPELAKDLPPLEVRTCSCGCGKTFKTLATSDTRFASLQCRYERGLGRKKMEPLLLLGFIGAGPNSVALFAKQHPLTVHESIDGFRFDGTDGRYVLLTKEQKTYFLLPGNFLGETDQIQIQTGIELKGEELQVTTQLRDYVADAGLVTIMMQAASEAVRDGEGEVVGYRIFEVDDGSIYTLAGLRNNDVVTEIDGTPLKSPFTVLRALVGLKKQDQFTFAFTRDGRSERRKVVIK